MKHIPNKLAADIVAIAVALGVGVAAPAANAAPKSCNQVLKTYQGATSAKQLDLLVGAYCKPRWYLGESDNAVQDRLSRNYGKAVSLLQKGRAADVAAAKRIVAKDWAAIIATTLPIAQPGLTAAADRKLRALTKKNVTSHYKVMFNYTHFKRVRDGDAKILAQLLTTPIPIKKLATVNQARKQLKKMKNAYKSGPDQQVNTHTLMVLLNGVF